MEKRSRLCGAKASETGITHYYDLSGAEITLNPGKTYIGICPSDD
ncbi:MAG: DUF3048 C-terminal domain-containing protein [Gallintestinimicrobium sp.]